MVPVPVPVPVVLPSPTFGVVFPSLTSQVVACGSESWLVTAPLTGGSTLTPLSLLTPLPELTDISWVVVIIEVLVLTTTTTTLVVKVPVVAPVPFSMIPLLLVDSETGSDADADADAETVGADSTGDRFVTGVTVTGVVLLPELWGIRSFTGVPREVVCFGLDGRVVVDVVVVFSGGIRSFTRDPEAAAVVMPCEAVVTEGVTTPSRTVAILPSLVWDPEA